MIRALAGFLVVCAAVYGASAGKVSVEASTSSDKATVLVNGQPVQPGDREVDGSHVSYQHREESGTQGSCRYSSVHVSSSGEEPTKISVQQGSGCDADSGEPRSGSWAYTSSHTSGHASGHMAGASDEFRARHRHSHNRDVRERRFFDVESMMNELRSGGSAGNGEDDATTEDGAPVHRHKSNSGSGGPGEPREVHMSGDGFAARARTAGTGAHHETIDAKTYRTAGGGVARSVRVSASSSSGGGQQADE